MPLLIITTTITFVLATVSRLLAEQLTERIAVLGSFFGLTLSHNSGIAFGVRIPSPWQEFLIVTALILVIVTAIEMRTSRIAAIAFGMILAGALANLADRFADGLVTDFIHVGSFPIFNLADSAITIGAALLIVESLIRKRRLK